jgi:hypothetical protein
MFGRNKKDHLKGLMESANNVDAPEVNEYLAVRSRNKHLNDLIKTNMVIFRRKCKDQLMRYKEENHIKGSWKNILIKRLGVESWDEVQDTWIGEIIDGASCDEVLDHLDDEFVKIHYGRVGAFGQTDDIKDYDGNQDQLTWSSGSSYKSKKNLTEDDKTDRVKKFERTDSFLFNEDTVVSIDYDVIDDGGNKMGVKFLDEIGVNRVTKRVSKKDIDDRNRKRTNDLTAYRKSMSAYVDQIQSNINGEGDGYGKNVLDAVKKNRNTGSYEVSMVRNNVPLMWGKSRYLSIEGDLGDVSSKLKLISAGILTGKLDSVLKEHKKRVTLAKNRTKS